LSDEGKSEKSYWKNGYVHKYHYYYGAALLTVVIILLTAFVFKASDYAGAMLSFAATLSSVLLAVIAIIITLIDVSGQKQNVYDLKKEVDKLGQIVKKSSSFSRELEDGLSKIEERYKENTNLLSSLYNLVEESKKDDNPEVFYEKAKKLFDKNIEMDLKNYENVRNSKGFKKARADIIQYIFKNPGINEQDVLSYFSSKHPINYMFFYREALNDLLFNEDIDIDKNGGLSSELPF
jgi:hypothetical protein